MAEVRPYRGKRLLDFVVVAAAALPALAIGLPAGLLVRLSSPGPVLFRQVRVGMDGRPFVVLKLRTMVGGGASPFPQADRITGVGRLLRRLSIDELPQLLNVVRGDMSLVGPRPALPYQVERYTAPQRGRLTVRPGLTGLAQISGRNALTWSERIEFDLEYVRRQSLSLDMQILLKTAAVVLGGGVGGHPMADPLARLDPVSPRTRPMKG